MTGAIVILVTAGSESEARQIARSLVEEGVVACVNLVCGIRSIYRWEGAIADEGEVLMVLKSLRSRFAEVERRIRELHSYEVPEILALDVCDGSVPYLDWLTRESESR